MTSASATVFHFLAVAVLISMAQCIEPPGNFSWPKNTDKLCFEATFNLTLTLTYLKTDKTNGTAEIGLNPTDFESYSVSCTEPNNLHALTLTMLKGFTTMTLEFTVDEKNNTKLSSIVGYITFNKNQDKFPNYDASLEGFHKFSSNVSLFETERETFYKCYSKVDVNEFNIDGNFLITSIEFFNTRIQSFADETGKFDEDSLETVCKADEDKESNVVPIVVGAVLAAMIVIVLVAYLVGRRRNRSGYDTV